MRRGRGSPMPVRRSLRAGPGCPAGAASALGHAHTHAHSRASAHAGLGAREALKRSQVWRAPRSRRWGFLCWHRGVCCGATGPIITSQGAKGVSARAATQKALGQSWEGCSLALALPLAGAKLVRPPQSAFSRKLISPRKPAGFRNRYCRPGPLPGLRAP